MSGHSKWSTIKRQKAATDQARGQIFTKLGAAITIACREGGSPDPESNFKLRLAIEKARSANMPKENIQRAIDKALGHSGGAVLEEVLYEGFAPGGVAVLVEAVTDNKQRTVAAVKNIFSTHGGSLGSSGSVAYLFQKVGAIHVTKDKTYDELLELVLETGGEDIEDQDDLYTIFTKPSDLHKVKSFLEGKVKIVDSELTFKPLSLVKVNDSSFSGRIISLLTALDELPDVQKVHANSNFE